MKAVDIARARVSNHLLGKNKRRTPDEVVAWLGAVQAQDFAAAKWAVGLRTYDATDADVEAAFNNGVILRTHVMRPTWHFVAPADLRSLLALTAARVHQANAHRYGPLGLDGPLLARCHRVLTQALQDHTYLTRMELAARLRKHRIEASGTRLAYILMHAELEGLICSGPLRGRQFTYALLDERARPARTRHGDEGLARWTLRYFTSHGPAQARDFAWWSGLSIEDARRGLEMAASQLDCDVIDGKTYWFSPGPIAFRPKKPRAWLLSLWDEYTIAYRDRSAIGEGRVLERLLSSGAGFTSVLIVRGTVAGTWKRTVTPGAVEIKVRPFTRLDRAERQAIGAAGARYGAFLGMRAIVLV